MDKIQNIRIKSLRPLPLAFVRLGAFEHIFDNFSKMRIIFPNKIEHWTHEHFRVFLERNMRSMILIWVIISCLFLSFKEIITEKGKKLRNGRATAKVAHRTGEKKSTVFWCCTRIFSHFFSPRKRFTESRIFRIFSRFFFPSICWRKKKSMQMSAHLHTGRR